LILQVLICYFFNPILRNSIKHDHGVGYFSSGWLKLASEGMDELAQNGGYTPWVTSPMLNSL